MVNHRVTLCSARYRLPHSQGNGGRCVSATPNSGSVVKRMRDESKVYHVHLRHCKRVKRFAENDADKKACVKTPRLSAGVAPCWLFEKQHPFKAKADGWIFDQNDANVCVIISLLLRDFLSQQLIDAAVQTVSISEPLMESWVCTRPPAGCQLPATVTPSNP